MHCCSTELKVITVSDLSSPFFVVVVFFLFKNRNSSKMGSVRFLTTRMHSSRMRTTRSSNIPGVSPWQRPAGQRPHWTEPPLDTPPWTETPSDKDPPGQRSPWTETSLDRDPPPPWTESQTGVNITFPQLRLRNYDCDSYSQHRKESQSSILWQSQ